MIPSLSAMLSWLFVNYWRPGRRVIRAEEVEEKYHPLLPAEKKLILYSLIAAVVLLVILVYVSETFFRGS